MKRLARFMTCIALGATVMATAHRANAAEISGMAGYQFGGQIETSGGDIEVNDGLGYIAEIEFPLKFKTGTSLMLMWGMHPTNLQLNTGGTKVDLGDMTAHYWHGGLLYNLRTDNPDLVPFTQVGLGATQLNPENGESMTKFSFGLGAGLKYAVNPKVKIRLQGELYATMLTSDAWVGVGTGGASIGLGGNALLQGALMGGVTLALGGKKDGEAEPPPQSYPEPAQPAPAQHPPPQQPPAQQPPPQQPPTEQPPAQQPPTEQPPAQQPPTEQPPATQPPATEPPATNPPATTTGTTPPSR